MFSGMVTGTEGKERGEIGERERGGEKRREVERERISLDRAGTRLLLAQWILCTGPTRRVFNRNSKRKMTKVGVWIYEW